MKGTPPRSLREMTTYVAEQSRVVQSKSGIVAVPFGSDDLSGLSAFFNPRKQRIDDCSGGDPH
jgi:hypothetical protein